MKTKRGKKIKDYSLEALGTLKGFVKNGLDSSTLINLVIVFDSKADDFRKRGYNFPLNLFYFHEISHRESVCILIGKHKFSKEEAVKAFDEVQQQFHLKSIRRRDSDEYYERLVEEANKRVVKREKNPRLKIGIQDIIILGGFLREKINIVHSGDKGFLETSKELGFNVAPMPKQDIEKENEIRRWSKKK